MSWPPGTRIFHSIMLLLRKQSPGEPLSRLPAPGGHRLTTSSGGIGSEVENMPQHPGPKAEKSRGPRPNHTPGPLPAQWMLTTWSSGSPCSVLTTLLRRNPPQPHSLQKGQQASPCPPSPRTPPAKQAKPWHYQESLTLGVRKVCSNPALPLTSCVTLSRSAASLSLSPLICFFQNKLITLRQACRLCTAQRHWPREQVGESFFLICPIA